MNGKTVRVVLFGVGPLGQRVAQAILERGTLEITGAIDLQNVGADLGSVLPLEKETGIIISDDVREVLKKAEPDAVIHMTASSLTQIGPQLRECANAGANVVTSCEELSFPIGSRKKLAEELDQYFNDRGATLLGTGINPGFLMDKLPLLLSGVMLDIEEVRVTRMMYSRVRRPSFQKKIGTGMDRTEFLRLIEDKVITGHVGLKESASMIVDGLGWCVDEIYELPIEPVICEQEVTTYTDPSRSKELMTVKPGQVAGLRNLVVVKKDGVPVVTLDFIAHANVEEGYDLIELDGVPNLRFKNINGMDGDIGTVAILINSIRRVLESPPGLVKIQDINMPVPLASKSN